MEVPYPHYRVVCYTDNTNGITVSVIQSRLMSTQCLDTTTTRYSVYTDRANIIMADKLLQTYKNSKWLWC